MYNESSFYSRKRVQVGYSFGVSACQGRRPGHAVPRVPELVTTLVWHVGGAQKVSEGRSWDGGVRGDLRDGVSRTLMSVIHHWEMGKLGRASSRLSKTCIADRKGSTLPQVTHLGIARAMNQTTPQIPDVGTRRLDPVMHLNLRHVSHQ